MSLSNVFQKDANTKTIYVRLEDSATRAGLTGLAFDTAGLTAYQVRSRAAAAAITLATQTVTGAWATGGFKEVSSTVAPGLYRLDVPNAVLATGVDEVFICFVKTGLYHEPHQITLTDYDPIESDPDVASIKAKTDNLPSDPADASVVAGLIAGLDTKLDTIDNYVDSEVAAIKTQTDKMVFTTAGAIDAKLVVTGMNNIVGYTP